MDNDKRKSQRSYVALMVKIADHDGKILAKCKMTDVSKGGAKLVFALPPELPDEFMLLLSRNRETRRPCKVRWRRENCVGVSFQYERGNTPAPPDRRH